MWLPWLLAIIPPCSLVDPSTKVSQRLHDLFRDGLRTDHITQLYQELAIPFQMDTEQLGDFVSNLMADEFSGTVQALKAVKTAAEAKYEQHVWDGNGSNWYVDVFTAPLKDNYNKTTTTFYHKRYDGFISLNDSAVSIPLDVYDNWTDVRNTIQWTQALDTVFQENYARHKDYLIWQYIGTPQGIMRTFPAMTLYPYKTRATFDVRTRPWYNAGIGRPKDVVLLIDKSGSMDGLPMVLMKYTTKLLINQILSDTDYVTAVTVGNTADFLTCLKLLRRATKSVKKMLIKGLDGVKAGGSSNWREAMNLAFSTLAKSKLKGQSTNCEKNIIIMSDQTSQPINEMARNLNKELGARIYVLSFRRHDSIFRDKLEMVACENRGYYIKVLNYAVVNAALQKIIQVGNMPLKGREIAPTWSNAYRDLGEIGVVVTVTLPVVVGTSPSHYNTDREHNHLTSLLGIVGLDFKVSRVVKIGRSVLPLHFNILIINNKGYPIFHPLQQAYEHVNTKLDEFQFTLDNNKGLMELQELMIKRQKGRRVIPNFINSVSLTQGTGTDRYHGDDWYQNVTYQVFPLPRSPFTLALVLTSTSSHFIHRNRIANVSRINSIVAQWGERMHVLDTTDACNKTAVLKNTTRSYTWRGNPGDVCNLALFALFTDILLSQHFVKAFLQPRHAQILNHFITTYTGITFFSSVGWRGDRTRVTTFTNHEYHQKASRVMEGVSVIVTQPVSRVGGRRTVSVLKPIRVPVGGNTGEMVHVATAGVEVDENVLKRYLFGKLSSVQRRDIRTLVDENGMAVMSLNGDVNGFLGNAYSKLFKILYRKNIYVRVKYTECIHTCGVEEPDSQQNITKATSAGCNPITLATLLRKVISMVIVHVRMLVVLLVYPRPVSPHFSVRETEDCCRLFDQFQRNFTWRSKLTVEIPCSGCSSRVTVSVVKGTNLLQVADHTPTCRCTDTSFSRYKGRRAPPLRDICNESSFVDTYNTYQTCVPWDSVNLTSCSGAQPRDLTRDLIVVLALSFVVRVF